MEIKCVKKEKIEYPKINEMSNKILKTCIPNKWMKLGINSLLFEFIINNKVFATTLEAKNIQVLGGDVATPVPVIEVASTTYINNGITIGTIILFVISILGFFITKNKLNKDNENQKTKKLKNIFKIVSITSVFIFIIWQIIYTFLWIKNI